MYFVADDMSTPNVKEGMQAAGVNSILPKEHGTKFYTLPFVKNSEKDVSTKVSGQITGISNTTI